MSDSESKLSDANAEIEFGQVEHSQPEPGLRPDQDKHFVVVACGEVNDNDLPIYVDMDVLRDMEAHARENTRVELGGVMLGRHHVDDEGRSFVVISDSLRARHYEATKGSFKFTHNTWNQITRERNEFRNDLELVGWYHTHPGWGVFLSGMDMFICRNFFDRPLDVALVIDPCAGDRGWFQWSEEESSKTRQTAGFYLMTNRHRQNELNYFSEMFQGQNSRIPDPRFRQAAFSNQLASTNTLEDTMVNFVDNRRPVFEFAIVSMLFLQLAVVGLIGWRITDEFRVVETDQVESRITAIEDRLISDNDRRLATIREQAYADILDTIVAGQTGQGGLVEKFAAIATQNKSLNENLEGQMSRAKQAIREKELLSVRLDGEKFHTSKLQQELNDTNLELTKVKDDLQKSLELDSENNGNTDEVADSAIPPWVWYSLGVVGLMGLGGLAGFFLTRVFEIVDNEDDECEPTDSTSNQASESNSGELSFPATESQSALSSNVK